MSNNPSANADPTSAFTASYVSVYDRGRVRIPGLRSLVAEVLPMTLPSALLMLPVGLVEDGWCELATSAPNTTLGEAHVGSKGRLNLPPHGVRSRFAVPDGQPVLIQLHQAPQGPLYILLASQARAQHQLRLGPREATVQGIRATGWSSPWSP